MSRQGRLGHEWSIRCIYDLFPLLVPIIVQRIGELLRQLRGTGATVLIAEQNMHFCLGLATHATVIDKGQIVYTSGIEELKANENIRQRYLAL